MTRGAPQGPRLHVLLGGGGVGKTTLAAGLALSLARSGRRVGLLTIDPAQRLQSALGLPALGEDPINVIGAIPVAAPGSTAGPNGSLTAAALHPAESLRRWAADALPDAGAREGLLANPFFLALADRLAGASDTIAAMRIAEWAEHDPTLDDLVIDTAPGLQAIDFLARPERLLAFLEGRLVGWVRRLAPTAARDGARPGLLARLLLRPARRGLDGLTRLGGTRMLSLFGDFLTLGDVALHTMRIRLEASRRWLQDPSTELLLVAAPRQDAARVAAELAATLAEHHLTARAVVLNRALPRSLGPALAVLDETTLPSEPARAFLRFARGSLRMDERVRSALGAGGLPVIELPETARIEEGGAARLDALAELGAALSAGLAAGVNQVAAPVNDPVVTAR